ncbi:hypothetical protein NEMIN01_1517 [Nematocida minor]|uniref:uncharacterized protein n=1 Tax=Nematocida minor TaxID=1912983 RepID=UPI0022203EE4|nr:uncharacterized protein NEMIN01_1517 [Nematocida minor]KAI5191441.1 hypothetical protein NEMIN01_1517 [Nematocida minor]
MQHSGALVALDTNVLMGKLDVVKGLSFLIENINMGLFIPCTVMRELDANKVRVKGARDAIVFIEQENARVNRKIFLEPAVSEKGRINDDTIVLSCKNNKVMLLLSDDTALRLKANNAGYNLSCISVEGKSAEELFSEIANFFRIEFMDFELKEDTVGSVKKLTAKIASVIYHEKVYPVVERELGRDLLPFYLPEGLDQSLSSLLAYVSKNSHLFTSTLPRSSIKIISKLSSKKVTTADLQLILDIFGVSSEGWI